jgi:hypothetical protein
MSYEQKEILSVTQVLAKPDGEVIDGVRGTILSIGAVEEKLRPNGEVFTVQSFSLWCLDTPANHINVSAFDHKNLDQYLNKAVVMLSMKSRNGRYGGITVAKEMTGGSLFTKHPQRACLRISKVGQVYLSGD